MKKIAATFTCFAFGICLLACNSNKPKPVSDTVGKTSVNVNGKRDSVINNPQKNYGNATLAEPCVKCLLEAVQASAVYKDKTAGVTDNKYVINYVRTALPEDTTNAMTATNALRVDVTTADRHKKLVSFLYDNAVARLYVLNGKNKNEITADSTAVKKIRNSCYWGVASGK